MNWNFFVDVFVCVIVMLIGMVQVIEDVFYIDVDGLVVLVEVESVQLFGFFFMMFNMKVELFDDVCVCQVLYYVFDMDKIIEIGMFGNVILVMLFLFEDYLNYYEVFMVYFYDLEKVEELLVEVGVFDFVIMLCMIDIGWVKEVVLFIKEFFDVIGIDIIFDISQFVLMYEKVDFGDYIVVIVFGDLLVFGVDFDLFMNWWYGENVWIQMCIVWVDFLEYVELCMLFDIVVIQEGEEQQEFWNQVYDLIFDQVVLYLLFYCKLFIVWSLQELVGFQLVFMIGLLFFDVGVVVKQYLFDRVGVCLFEECVFVILFLEGVVCVLYVLFCWLVIVVVVVDDFWYYVFGFFCDVVFVC